MWVINWSCHNTSHSKERGRSRFSFVPGSSCVFPQPCPKTFPHIDLRSLMCQLHAVQMVLSTASLWGSIWPTQRGCSPTDRAQGLLLTLQMDRTLTVPPGWTFLPPFHFITCNCKNVYLFHIYSLFFFLYRSSLMKTKSWLFTRIKTPIKLIPKKSIYWQWEIFFSTIYVLMFLYFCLLWDKSKKNL